MFLIELLLGTFYKSLVIPVIKLLRETTSGSLTRDRPHTEGALGGS